MGETMSKRLRLHLGGDADMEERAFVNPFPDYDAAGAAGLAAGAAEETSSARLPSVADELGLPFHSDGKVSGGQVGPSQSRRGCGRWSRPSRLARDVTNARRLRAMGAGRGSAGQSAPAPLGLRFTQTRGALAVWRLRCAPKAGLLAPQLGRVSHGLPMPASFAAGARFRVLALPGGAPRSLD